jgi:hypothetical protein
MSKKFKATEQTAARILIYERDAPKLDVYTIEQRCFANFSDAYLWGLEQFVFKKDSSAFSIIGKKFKRQLYTRKNFEDWFNKPFNRMDCEEVCWDFDEFGELQSRSYDYYGIGFEYMPSDTEADAGTHFKKGDLVKACDTICVISMVPSRKKDNRWENYYTVLEIIKKDDGRIYTRHGHFHESNLEKFTEPIAESEPLWFLHQVFAGKIKLTKEQGNIIDAELRLVNGEWRGN